MTYLYPSFLWALLALSIPIIIHLFNFRRAKTIYFSNVKFLENVKESSSSKLKLKYLLVLFTRLMFIAFLVLAFAQPFLPGNEEGMNSSSVIVYLDNSQSSSNLTASNNSGLNTAIDYLNQIIALYPAETKYKIITNDFAPSSINYKSKEKALELATELNYSNLTRSLAEVIKKIELSASEVQNSDVYLISDFQKSVFDNSNLSTEDSANNYKIIPIEYLAHQNVFVDSIYLESPFLLANNTNKLHVKIKSVGTEDANDLLVKLFINDKQAATTSIDIAKESTQELVFDLNYRLEDINKCRITFEDFPITFDNEYYFTLNLLKKINVVEIKGTQSSYLKALFSENDLFKYTQYNIGAINFSQTSAADLVIFNQINNYENSIKGLISDLMNAGKSVFIIPSENQSIAGLSSVTSLPITKIDGKQKIAVDIPDLKNPFFEKTLATIDNKTILPTVGPVISWLPMAQDILKLKNGLPFLSKLASNGNMYLLSSPLIDEHTNLHKHALFVPIMYRMAALSSNSNHPLSYTIGNQLIALDKDTVRNDELYKLSNVSQELIPQQHTSTSKLLLDIPRYLINPSYYELTLGGEVKNVLAFNFTKAESLTAPLSQDELRSSFSGIKNIEILLNQKVETFTSNMKERYEGLNLWKYALILSLIFLLAEVLLLRFL